MKNSGTCPKCNSKSIYGPTRRTCIDQGIMVRTKSFFGSKRTRSMAYICLNCSFIEEYLSDEQLTKVRKWAEFVKG